MYYYIIDENNIITNSIVIDDGTDPSIFGAVADPRAFNIGDQWRPENPGPAEYTAADMFAALLSAQKGEPL